MGQKDIADNNHEAFLYKATDNILSDVCYIIDSTQKIAFNAINLALIQRNWYLGKRIAEEELKGKDRAEYGIEIIKSLSKSLTDIYGKGFNVRQLYYCESFYKTFPEILHTVCAKSYPLLSWSHYRILLQVKDPTARDWYAKEAHNETWNVRTLQRNIDSQYYYRLLKSQIKEPVKQEMKELTSVYQQDKLEFIKNPVVVEFLGLTSDPSLNETTLESSIISNLQKFLMELGKGYAFVARQQHIHTEKEDYYKVTSRKLDHPYEFAQLIFILSAH